MKKIVVGILAFLTLSACSSRYVEVTAKNGLDGSPGKDGSSCSVSNLTEGESVIGALISCTDGSWSQIFNGAVGATGAVGETGAAGTSCTVHRGCEDNFVTITCGEYTASVYDGESGPTGPQGNSGSNGENGISPTCTTTFVATDFTFKDYSELPEIEEPAFCKKNSYPYNKNTSNVIHGNSCPTGWTFHAAELDNGEYEIRTVTINIPTVVCSTPTPSPTPIPQ
jgi:hypothetical protein